MKRPALTLVWATLLVALVATLGSLAKAQLQQVQSGTWAPMATIGTLPAGTAAAALEDGRIVVVGGSLADGAVSNTVAIFDPVSAQWVNAGTMTTARTGHAVAALKDGRVLIAGGTTGGGVSAGLEIFDPVAGTSADAGVMTTARTGLAAATLDDGRVLLAGGSDGNDFLASAEIFDPATGAVSAAGFMLTPRSGLSATTLIDGRVLVAGGADASGELAAAEVFDPVSGGFSASSAVMNVPRSGHVALRLAHNNAVLIAGGQSAGAAVDSAELYFSWNDSFVATGSMAEARVGAIGLPIPQDGLAGVVSGSGLASAEAYGFATVKTDKDDYAPGETVTITGSGWEPNEPVLWTLEEVSAPPGGTIDGPYTFPAQADENGNLFDATWAPNPGDLGVGFHLTVVGSKSQAQTKFTDGNASVSGTVRTSATDAPPIGGATVTCSGGCNVGESPVVTNASGGYAFSKLNFPGSSATVQLTASASGFVSQTLELSISNIGGPYTRDFSLSPAVTTVTASVTASSRPYDGTAAASIASCTLTGVALGDTVT